MNKNDQPGIKFNNIFLIEESFMRDPMISSNLNIKLDFKVERKMDANNGRVLLKTQLNLINNNDHIEVECSFTYLASFSVDESNENMEMDFFLNNNAPALMFPYVRQHIQSITANAGLPPLILAPMNIIAMLNQKPEEEEL